MLVLVDRTRSTSRQVHFFIGLFACTHVVSFVILSIMVLCLLLHQRLELQNSDAQSFLFIRVLCFVLYLHHVLSVSSQLVLNFSRFLFERSCFLSVTLSLLS